MRPCKADFYQFQSILITIELIVWSGVRREIIAMQNLRSITTDAATGLPRYVPPAEKVVAGTSRALYIPARKLLFCFSFFNFETKSMV